MKTSDQNESRLLIGKKIQYTLSEYLALWIIAFFFVLYILIVVITQNNPVQVILGHTLDGAIIALGAIGFSLIFGVAKQLKLSAGGYYVLGAYTMYFLVETMNLSVNSSIDWIFSVDGLLTLGLGFLPILLIVCCFAFFLLHIKRNIVNIIIIVATLIGGLFGFVATGNVIASLFIASTVILVTFIGWYFELSPNKVAIISIFMGFSYFLLELIEYFLELFLSIFLNVDYEISISIIFISLGILAALFTAILGMIEDRYLLNKARHSAVNVLIITFAVALLIQSIVQLLYFPKNGGFEKFGPNQRFISSIAPKTDIINVFGASISVIDFFASLISIAIIILLYFFIWYTKMGSAIRAVAQDEDAAAIVGINIRKITAIVSGIGFGLIGLTSVLIAPIKAVPFWSPFMGWFVLIQMIVVVTLGGLGSFSGTIIASFVYAYAIGIIGIFLSSFGVVFPFVIVLIVIIFKPEGILGRKKELETSEIT